MLVCVPVPADVALPEDEARAAIDQANAEAEVEGVHGPALTPWLLARMAERLLPAVRREATLLLEKK